MRNEIINEIRELNSIDKKELLERMCKFQEEYGEFNAEVGKMIGITEKPFDREHLKEEMADAMQCMFSIYLDICDKQNFTIDDIFDEIIVKNKKWRKNAPLYGKNIK